MSEFDRPLAGYRWVETRHGDSLQAIALREFGDASDWPRLAHLNDLLPPYITDDPALAGERVLLSGQAIMVPAAFPSPTGETDPDRVFGVDCLLVQGELLTEGGDLAVVSGRENLLQAIKHRLATTPGDLMFHGSYGCYVRTLLGAVNGPSARLLAGQYVRTALAADPRISEVARVGVVASGDEVRVDAEVIPVSGNEVLFEGTI